MNAPMVSRRMRNTEAGLVLCMLGRYPRLIWCAGCRCQVVTTALPKLEELAEKLRGWNPNVLHLCGGVNGGGAGLATQPAQPVAARGLLNAEGGTSAFVTAVAGLDLHLVYLDAANGMALGGCQPCKGIPCLAIAPCCAACERRLHAPCGWLDAI